MAKKYARLPDAELEVMKTVWGANKPVPSSYIMKQLEGQKSWGLTTVLNLLSRLIERGFLECRKDGKFNIYTPVVDEKIYLENESKSFLERLHGNSLKSLVASLYDSDSLTEKDFEDLKQFIDEHARHGDSKT